MHYYYAAVRVLYEYVYVPSTPPPKRTQTGSGIGGRGRRGVDDVAGPGLVAVVVVVVLINPSLHLLCDLIAMMFENSELLLALCYAVLRCVLQVLCSACILWYLGQYRRQADQPPTGMSWL